MVSCVRHATHTAEHATKQFLACFHREYTALLLAIQGIPDEATRASYASLLLNRLLFLAFLQQHGLLYRDDAYLSNQLHLTHTQYGQNTFYRTRLLPLCDQLALALNISLFRRHPLEYASTPPHIPDDAFKRLFAFFARYHWQLDRRIPPSATQLHPGIVSRLFEQQLDRKQMGVYYTHEDVALYITCNTLIPCLFASVQRDVPELFVGGIESLLRQEPDRYLYAEVRSSEQLPAETSQEYQARSARIEGIRALCLAGKLTQIEDAVSHNLDILRLAKDYIEQCKEPELLHALYRALAEMRILDPTCGSGAFLLAALAVLEQLYTSCLTRMQALLKSASMSTHLFFCTHLERIAQHPTQRHFIISECIKHNLYGVDIMNEAVEVCKCLLLLELLTEVKQIEEHATPSELDTHLCTGNALLGQIREQGEDTYPQQSFHWYKAFPEVMERGGFDVIIGNPPYVEYSRVRQEYKRYGHEFPSSGNLYAAVIERSLELCRPGTSALGLVVPLSLCSSERFATLRKTLVQQTSHLWLANFEIFPSRLFEEAFQRLSILLGQRRSTQHHTMHVTRLQRWYAQERPHLMHVMRYTSTMCSVRPSLFPKLASPLQEDILQKITIVSKGHTLACALHPSASSVFIYYQEATNYWIKATCRIPYYKKNGHVTEPAHGRFLYFTQHTTAQVVMALLNSSLFYIWFATYADGFHLSHTLVKAFPLDPQLLCLSELADLAQLLEKDIQQHASIHTRNTRKGDSIEIEEYRMYYCKERLDEIDALLAHYYGLNAQELSFIINYDGKYRLRQNNMS